MAKRPGDKGGSPESGRVEAAVGKGEYNDSRRN
jgi:hypothetical protein